MGETQGFRRFLQHRGGTFGLIVGSVLGTVAYGIAMIFGKESVFDVSPGNIILLVLALGVASYLVSQEALDRRAGEKRIERVEQQFLENPEKPQLAWDLARTKLENYLDRNLSQVRSIYWLTLMVMLFGFTVVLYGLYQAARDPSKLPFSIVASSSGVLVSFVGGSFLIIYRSILTQSREYVTVLERINAVGMAVQIISSIPDANLDLRNSAMAALANKLLALYAVNVTHKPED
jgi:hypothetical protein